MSHLWFLYVLILLYAATLLVRGIARLLDPNGRVGAALRPLALRAMRGPWAPVWLAAPLTAALGSYPRGIWWFGVPTPDQSLLPNAPALAAFATAYALGWFVHGQRDILQAWQQSALRHLFLAVVFTVLSLSIVGPTPSYEIGAADGLTWLYLGCYSVAAWSWSFAIIGLALRFFAEESPVRRYVSDASYWIYIMHLPVVFLLQAAFMTLPLHWTLKFPLILVVAFAILFGTYHTLVRFTFVGKVLNGRRHERGVPAHTATATASAA